MYKLLQDNQVCFCEKIDTGNQIALVESHVGFIKTDDYQINDLVEKIINIEIDNIDYEVVTVKEV